MGSVRLRARCNVHVVVDVEAHHLGAHETAYRHAVILVQLLQSPVVEKVLAEPGHHPHLHPTAPDAPVDRLVVSEHDVDLGLLLPRLLHVCGEEEAVVALGQVALEEGFQRSARLLASQEARAVAARPAVPLGALLREHLRKHERKLVIFGRGEQSEHKRRRVR